MPQIEVAFDIDSNGIVSVQAKDVATSREQKILVTPSSGLSEGEISSIIDDAQKHADEDRRRGGAARARLEGLVDSNQKTLRRVRHHAPRGRQEGRQRQRRGMHAGPGADRRGRSLPTSIRTIPGA